MGLRFRKSINLGGGFRVNLSKSGIGYSWGTKGLRMTKTASGQSRTTVSIPGTGLSCTQNLGINKSRSNNNSLVNNQNINMIDNNHYGVQEIKNAEARTLSSEGLEEMLASANKVLFLWNINKFLFWISLILGCAFPLFWLLTIFCLIFGIYLKKNAVIDIEYTFEDDRAIEVEKRMQPLIAMSKSSKLWWVSQSSKVINKKYAAGASNTIKRNKCKAFVKAPFPFKTNSTSVAFSSGKETILFLPDKLFVIQGSKIGALSYSDVTISIHKQSFIERETVPRDAQIIDYTWQYVNKSGGPDKRFQNNKKIPVCLYGEMEVRSEKGVNTDIMCSNANIQ